MEIKQETLHIPTLWLYPFHVDVDAHVPELSRQALLGALVDSVGASIKLVGAAHLANRAEEGIAALGAGGGGGRGGGCRGHGGGRVERRALRAVVAPSLFDAIVDDGAAELVGLAKDGVAALDALGLPLLKLLRRRRRVGADGKAAELFDAIHIDGAAVGLVAWANLVAALVGV